jgi:hypothetical protein
VENACLVKNNASDVFMVGLNGDHWVECYREGIRPFSYYCFQAEIPLEDAIERIDKLARHLGLE